MTDNRTVRFYALINLDGGARRYLDPPWEDVAERVATLVESNAAEWKEKKGTSLLPTSYDEWGGHYPFTLYRVSSVDLPMLYNPQTNELRSLDEIMGDESLSVAEPTHFLMLPGGVVGILYNHRGPKARDFGTYMARMLGWNVELRPIPRLDALEALEEAGEVKALRIALPKLSADALAETRLGGASMLMEDMAATEVEVIIRARGHEAREMLADRARGVARGEDDLGKIFRKFQVQLGSGEDYAGDGPLNLLDEYLAQEVEVETVSGRRYVPLDEALEAILQSFGELRGSLASGLEAFDPTEGGPEA